MCRVVPSHLRTPVQGFVVVGGGGGAVRVEGGVSLDLHHPGLSVPGAQRAVQRRARQVDGAGYKKHDPPLLRRLKH